MVVLALSVAQVVYFHKKYGFVTLYITATDKRECADWTASLRQGMNSVACSIPVLINTSAAVPTDLLANCLCLHCWHTTHNQSSKLHGQWMHAQVPYQRYGSDSKQTLQFAQITSCHASSLCTSFSLSSSPHSLLLQPGHADALPPGGHAQRQVELLPAEEEDQPWLSADLSPSDEELLSLCSNETQGHTHWRPWSQEDKDYSALV